MECGWICPNDRHLALRAKLRAGWSSRTTQQGKRGDLGLSEAEMQKIKNVILKASMLEEMEQERIGCLVQRLNIMCQNSMGDGKATCILCAEQFGKFVGSSPIICMDCKTKVCSKCCVDYGMIAKPVQTRQSNQQIMTTSWLCKICSENRELWKRSGAWFFQSLPDYKLPTETPSDQRSRRTTTVNGIESPRIAPKTSTLAIPHSPHVSRGHNRSLSGGSVGSYQWAKPKAHFTSSSDAEESSDDDGITLGKARANSMQSRSIDTASMTSSTSASTEQHTLSTPSPGMNRRGSRRTTFRSGGKKTDSFRGRKNPKVQITDDADTISIESGSTEASSHDGGMIVNEFSSFGGTMGSASSLRSDELPMPIDKEKRGMLEFSLLYDPLKSALHVHVIRGKNLQAKDANGFSDPYVKLHILPGASRATKLRTKTRSRTLDPVFDESLTYWGILQEELPTRQLLLTVLDQDRFSHNDFIGEIIVPLESTVPTKKENFILPLQRMYALSEKDKKPRDPGRVLVGLRYHTQEHCLAVTIFRCANLVSRNPNDNINPFVKVTLMLDSKPPMSQKTAVTRKNQNPVFNSELKFILSGENNHAEIAKGSLQVHVLHKHATGQEMIGSLQFGIHSAGEKLRHWFNCLKNPDQQFDTWHVLSFESPKKSKMKQ